MAGRGLHLAASWMPTGALPPLSLRRAKQLSSVQEDGAGGASNSGAPHEAEDEVSGLVASALGAFLGSCCELSLFPTVPVAG